MMNRQDPGDVRFYEVFVLGEIINSGTWAAVPVATLGTPAVFTEATGSGSRVLFGPATAGVYVLTCNAVGASGQVYERSVTVKVEELF